MTTSPSASPTRRFYIPKYIRGFFFTSMIISCVVTLFTTIAFFRLPPVIPLFYSLAEPVDYLAPKTWLFVLPLFSITVTLGHIFLLPILHQYQRVMNQLFGWLTIIVQLLCMVATIRIMMIVW